MDFERSEVNLREDMALKNEYFMRDYTRFIGNPSKVYRENNTEEEEEEDEEEEEGSYVNYIRLFLKNIK